ncbi:acyltransferase [Luminiphilus sp.]|nr:acyltransferase [Luminiphilus sp.]
MQKAAFKYLRQQPSLLVWLMRGLFWCLLNRRRPRLLMMGHGAQLRTNPNARLPIIMKLGRFSTVDLRGADEVDIGERFVLGDFSFLIASGSAEVRCPYVTIGDNVSFGPFAYIGGGFGLHVGSDVAAGGSVTIHPENHSIVEGVLLKQSGISGKGISIGSDLWIGQKTTFLDGVEVGDRVVIGAGSVVNKSIASKSVYAGVPAKQLSRID